MFVFNKRKELKEGFKYEFLNELLIINKFWRYWNLKASKALRLLLDTVICGLNCSVLCVVGKCWISGKSRPYLYFCKLIEKIRIFLSF